MAGGVLAFHGELLVLLIGSDIRELFWGVRGVDQEELAVGLGVVREEQSEVGVFLPILILRQTES